MSIIQKINGKLAYWRRGLSLFVWKPSYSSHQKKRTDISFREITEMAQLENYRFAKGRAEDCRDRFLKNEICCVLERDSEVLTYGWVNPNRMHHLGELAVNVNYSENTEMLYNFETDPKHRGKGLYPYLLSRICERNNKFKIIYALAHNGSSIKGIRKASFLPLGTVYGINRNKVHQLLQKIWQE